MTVMKRPWLTRRTLGASSARPRLVALLLVAVFTSSLATTTASAAPSLPSCRIADVATRNPGYSDWGRSLLDRTYRLSSRYRPADLSSTSAAGLNGGFLVRRLIIADLKAMAGAASAAGARLSVQSAFRGYSTQRSTFSYWVRVGGYAAAIRTSARAGHSEHQLGTTVDFRSYRGSAAWHYTDWGTSRAGRWLKANAWKYGFVMSYPKGKSGVTCYAYEPWHYRYVGKAKAADIRASGLTLREYLWRQQTAPTPTPTPAPTPSPTASPEATPTASPEASPEATPSPTASPEAPSPTASPEATPTASPEATATATPATTPEPTLPPEPTPTPVPPDPSLTPAP